MASAPRLGGGKAVELDDEVFGAAWNEPLVHECVRAELAARRRGTASTLTRGKVRGGGAKPWRQKGTGRARAGSIRSPIWTGGGIVFGPSPRSLHGQGQPQGAPRRAAQRAVAARRARLARRGRRRRASTSPRPSSAAELLGGWDQPRSTLVVLGRRGGGRGQVVPQHRARERARRPRTRGSPTSSARRRCWSREAALERSSTRAGAPASAAEGGRLMDPSQVIIRPVVSEKSYALAAADKLHVPRPPGRAQDPDPPGRRAALRRQGGRRAHHERALQAQAPRADLRPHARLEEGHRPGRAGRHDPGLRRPRARRGGRRLMAIRKPKPTRPGRRFATYPDFSEITKKEPESSLVEGISKKRRAQHPRPQDLPPPRRRRQAAVPPDRLQAAQGRRAGARSRRSSTTRTARRYIALLHYVDGDKTYILAPPRLRVGMTVESGPGAEISVGNACRWPTCRSARSSTTSSSSPGRGGQLGRAAGRGDPAHGEGGRIGDAAPALR